MKITTQRDVVVQGVSLVIEGRLAGPWVEELNTYCRKLSEEHQRCVMIDLTGVTFIDVSGKALLSTLWQEGAELRAAGCLTKCVVEEITGLDRSDPLVENRCRRTSSMTEDKS